MADESDKITKIYSLQEVGYDDLITKLKNVNQAFIDIRKNKVDLNNASTKIADPAELARINALLSEQRVKEAELRVEKLKASNDLKALDILKKQELARQKEQIAGNSFEANSYAAVAKARRELYALVKNVSSTSGTTIDFQGQNLNFDQAIAKLKELSAAEQAFRRQFQADGTLVGEYTTGIVNAFKKMGLGDLVAGQITKAQGKLNDLNANFETLRAELVKVSASGGTAFETLERQLIDNRKETAALEAQVGQLNREFRGAGDIGNQITSSISNGFKNARNQVAQLVLSYVGFQAIFAGLQRSFDETVRLDSLGAALQVVSVTEAELAVNTQFLQTTTRQLGLTLLDTEAAFKNFYAASTQAGIGAEETRKIFFAAAAASANLKLSQEDTNGVLLAFSQIASKGKVQAEELRGQIGERVPGAFAIAARAIGVTQQELNKMLENGQVLANEFLPKFAAELQRTFGGDASRQVEGLQATLNRFKNEFTDLVAQNQKGLTAIISSFTAIGGAVLTFIGILSGIPFPLVIVGLTALTASLALYKAEQIRSYIVTQIASREGLIYRAVMIAQALATNAVRIATRLATTEIILFNGAIRVTPLGIILTLLGLVAVAFGAYAENVNKATRPINAFNDVNKEANKTIAEQTGVINGWAAILRSSKTSIDTKRKAVEELTKVDAAFGEVLKDNVVDLDKLDAAYKRVTESIALKARAEASSKLTAEKENRVTEIAMIRQQIEQELATTKNSTILLRGLSESQQALLRSAGLQSTDGNADVNTTFAQKVLEKLGQRETEAINTLVEFEKLKVKSQADLDAYLKKAAGGGAAQTGVFGVDIPALKAQLDAINKEIDTFKGAQADLAKKIAERDKLQEQYNDLLAKGSTTTGRGSRLTGTQRDQFKDIEANRNLLLAQERLTRQELNKEYGFREQDEAAYLERIRQINDAAIGAKLNLIRGQNAEERKIIAELKLEKINNEVSTNDQLFKLRETALQEALEQETKAAELQASRILSDPTKREFERTQAKLDADNRILTAQQTFDDNMNALEKQFGLKSKKNAEDRLQAMQALGIQINKEIAENTAAQLEQSLVNSGEAASRAINEIKQNIASQTISILSNSALSGQQQGAALEGVRQQGAIGILGNEIAQLQIDLPKYRRQLELKIITEQEYSDKLTELKEKQAALAEAQAKREISSVAKITQALRDGIKNLTSFFTGARATQEEQGAALDAALKNAEQGIQDTYTAFFNNELRKVDDAREIAKQRLDIEKEQVLAHAQSEEERQAIDKQYKAKADQIEQEAAKKRKSLALKQMAIEFGVASVKTLAEYAYPANLIALAGLTIAYLGKFALVNSQQFAHGGEVPGKGGRFGGKPHSQGGTPFAFKGRSFDAEVDELAVIRTKNAPKHKKFTVSGTLEQIASATNVLGGGVAFKPGASLRHLEFGGNLGEGLQAPAFVAAVNSGNNDKLYDLLSTQALNMAAQTQAINGRIDRIEVVQKTSTVSQALRKEVNQSNVATL